MQLIFKSHERNKAMKTDLHEKAMLVSLSISQWTARKYDKKVSKETAERYGTDERAGRYNKVLIAQQALKTIQKVVNASRTYHYENTLPWFDGITHVNVAGKKVEVPRTTLSSDRMLPAANFDVYSETMRDFRRQFESVTDEFIHNYPDLVKQAEYDLNGMFDPNDYPELIKIQFKFGFSFNIKPLPYAEDFRVDLQSNEVDRIKREIKERSAAVQKGVNHELWKRLHDVIKKMVERLSDTDKVFRDSLVWNVCELAELLPRLNINDDPQLKAMSDKIINDLCVHDPSELRENPVKRQDTCDKAKALLKESDAIMDKMEGMFGV